jgi:hypothetical protein
MPDARHDGRTRFLFGPAVKTLSSVRRRRAARSGPSRYRFHDGMHNARTVRL